MVCCLLGAFLLGMIFRGARWTGRSVQKVFHRPAKEPVVPIAPTPVYELPDYLKVEDAERVPELV